MGFDYETAAEDEKHWKFIFQESFSETWTRGAEPVANLDSDDKKEEEKPAYLDPEAYFRLLEHDELKQARKSSFWATILATIAIAISIFSTWLSIDFAQEQIETSIKPGDLNQLKFDQETLNSKLDTMIQNQEELIEVKKTSIMNKGE